MKIFTIGFTRKSAESFFTKLKAASVKRLVDIRLNNISQLAGFTKKDDLRYFVKEICGIEYTHLPELAPTQDILKAYKKKQATWSDYEHKFLELLRSRRVEESIPREILDGGCLLCSEEKPDHCHRRLVAEYLREKGGTSRSSISSDSEPITQIAVAGELGLPTRRPTSEDATLVVVLL